ncbi:MULTISPECIES: hypothetical protein [unclassified Meiothermus]|nr:MULTISPECIES: hypothetical protein [unclassified Meiothermus]
MQAGSSRASVRGTLHRISAIRDRYRTLAGLTRGWWRGWPMR